MSEHLKRNMALSMLLSATAGAGGTYVFFETSLPDQFLEALPIAEAVNEMEDAVWPPAPPAPPTPDAGPRTQGAPDDERPPLPTLPARTATLEARYGMAEGIHFIEAVFGAAEFDDSLPIVMVLHGRGGSAQLPGGPFHGLTHPVRVIVPQAPDALAAGYEWLPVRVGSGLLDRLSSSLVATGSRLARFLRSVEAKRQTRGRAIVTGFSQGGLVTFCLALYHDDVVGAAIPLSAWLPPPLEPPYRRSDIRYPRIRSMHGTIDDIIPIEPTRELFERLREQSFDVELVEFDSVAHETSPAMNDLFHHWLEAAICEAMADRECAFAAEQEARRLQGLEPLDAGMDAPELLDATLDGLVDGDMDASDAELDADDDAGEPVPLPDKPEELEAPAQPALAVPEPAQAPVAPLE